MERATVLVSILLTIATAAIAGPAVAADDQLDRYRREQLLHNAVVIRVFDAGRWESGFGLIFGRGGDVVWIATAAHVVFPKYSDRADVGLAPASRIEVIRRGDTRTWHVTRRAEMTGVGDLAFLPVDMPLHAIGADQWVEPSIDSDPRPGDPVHIAGYQLTIDYFSKGGKVAGVDAAQVPEVTDLGGGRGQSGAGVATDRGFIGLYTQSAGQRFIPIREIQRAALEAQRPWRLTDAPPPVRVTRLCLNVRGVAPETIRVAGASRLTGLDDSGCAETQSGPNRLSSTAPWVVCKPDRVEVPSDRIERISVDCVVSVAGVWSGEHGFIEITQEGDNKWRLKEGLSRSPHGWIVGTLTGKPPSLSLDGRTQGGLPIDGQVRVEGNRISGRVFVGGAPWQLELSR